ncbi:hypothetical protein NM208_g16899 [Fusarium decemcellulare]|uniref:Uncharacterized protein n=1 Tax=Fusarium decemcellulare TaxID=57161 RepID=A0ACC1R8W7_9HYPO|nr:hypothetical protein NM208_g16899 [Fusarium decemcellulare]
MDPKQPYISLPGFDDDELFSIFEDLSPMPLDSGSPELGTDGGGPPVDDADTKAAGDSTKKPYTPYAEQGVPASQLADVEMGTGDQISVDFDLRLSDLEKQGNSNKENLSSPENVKSAPIENPFTLQPPRRTLEWDLNSFSASKKRTGVASLEERKQEKKEGEGKQDNIKYDKDNKDPDGESPAKLQKMRIYQRKEAQAKRLQWQKEQVAKAQANYEHAREQQISKQQTGERLQMLAMVLDEQLKPKR